MPLGGPDAPFRGRTAAPTIGARTREVERLWEGAAPQRARELLSRATFADGWLMTLRPLRPPPAAAGVVLAALLSTGISACLQTESQRRATLRASAKEILPATATIRSLGYGECVELAPSPSCARVVFELHARESFQRAESVRAAAKRHGWKVTHSYDGQGGWSLFLKRKEFTALVVLWRPERYPRVCRGHGRRDEICFNTLNLTRH